MSEKLSLSVPADLAVGRMAVLVPSITPVEEWVYGTSARESWDIREFPDQLIITPKRPGSVEIGVRAGGSKTTTWTEVVVSPNIIVIPKPAPTPWKWPNFGWLAKLVPSGETLKHVAKGAGIMTGMTALVGLGVLIAWLKFRDPLPTPGPTPEPNPPTPVDPKTLPIPAPGLHVLVIYESTKAADKAPLLTAKQMDELYSEAFDQYLTAKCAKDADGSRGARFWDKETPIAGAAEHWRQAMGRTRTSVPWLIISGGKNGNYEGPLPDGGILDLIKKYGG